MKKNVMISLMAVMALGLTACKRDTPKQLEPEKPAAQAPMPGSPDEVVMSSGDIQLTMKDYDRCIAVHRFAGRMFSKRALANPRFQHDEAQRCFQVMMMRQYARDRQVEPDETMRKDSISAAMKRHEANSREQLLAKLGIRDEELDLVVNDALLLDLIQKDLTEKLDPGAARSLFDLDERRFTFELIDFPNEPTEEEIAAFQKEKGAEIAKFAGDHPQLLSSPPKARFIRMAFAKSGDDEDALAYKRAEELRLTAIKDGVSEAMAWCRQQAEHACQIVNDSENLYVEERTDENAWAFRMAAGSVSEVQHKPVAEEVWILHDVVPPMPYDTKDPGVNTMLAQKAMIAMTAAPHLLASLKPALEAPNPDLAAIAQENGGKYRKFEDLPYRAMVESQAVESPIVLKFMAEMKPEEQRLFSNPIVDNQRVYVFYVSQMTMPTDEDYRQNGDKWRQIKSKDPQHGLAMKWLAEHVPNMSSLNIKPVETAYGILQPNGTIR